MNSRSAYLEWIKALEFPKYNLGMSGMYYTGTVKDLGIEAGNLQINTLGKYGSEAFREALSNRYGVPEGNILICIGTSGVNYLLFKSLFSAGDEVLIETPVYDPLPAALQAVGARPVFLPRDPAQGYQFDESLILKLLTVKTKGLVLTNLHNPTGVMISADKLKSLADLLGQRGCYLIVDEVYLEFYFGKGPETAFHLADNIITTSSLTKAFGLGGLRAGWSFAPVKAVEKARSLYNLIVGSGPGITEYIASRIVSDEFLYRKFADKAEKLIEMNLPLVEDFIVSRSELSWVKPDGGITCFPLLESSEKVEILQRTLYDDYETLIMPGRFFSAPMGFRLSYGIEPEMLKQGLKNIGMALDMLGFRLTGKG